MSNCVTANLTTLPWKTSEPPKDGTPIVAVGRVISPAIEESATIVEPFTACVHWINAFKGWYHFHGSQMSVAMQLEEEVKIDFWLEYPAAPGTA